MWYLPLIGLPQSFEEYEFKIYFRKCKIDIIFRITDSSKLNLCNLIEYGIEEFIINIIWEFIDISFNGKTCGFIDDSTFSTVITPYWIYQNCTEKFPFFSNVNYGKSRWFIKRISRITATKHVYSLLEEIASLFHKSQNII